jgi:putative ABC transport system permease protein
VLWTFAVGTLVTLAAAYVPARRAATVPPVAAMLDDASRRIRSLRSRARAGSAMTAAGGVLMVAAGANPTGGNAGILLGGGALLVFAGVTMLSPVLGKPAARVLGWPFARFLGAAGTLGRENAQRNPRRTAATASALMIGLALSGAVTVMASSLKMSLDRQLDEGLGSDYVVVSKGENPFSPRATDAVSRVPGVRSAVAIRTARLELDGRVRSAVAGDPRPLAEPYRLTMTDGPLALAAGELLISRHIARSNDWAVGTTVAARFADGERGSLRVAGIYADPPIGPAIILDPASYRAHYPSTLISQIEITTNPTADSVATRQELQSALQAWPGLDLQDQEDIKAAAHSSIDEFVSAILALLALSVVIAALGIVNTLGLSVIERTRELGLLRAVGMDRGQLRHMIRYESLIIAVFGALLGLGLGVLYGSALQRASAADGMAALSIPFRQLGLYLLAGIAIGVAAAIWPARRAARVRILQAISHE